MAGRPCAVCRHTNRSEIERALESGEALRAVAARFGISSSSLHRHVHRHYRKVAWTSEPVRPVEMLHQGAATQDAIPVVPPPLPPAFEAEEPSRVTTRSEPEAPAQPAAEQGSPTVRKYTGGRLDPCTVCGSNRWRQLDGHQTCDACHPLPSLGSFTHIGQARSGRLGAAMPMTGAGASSVPIRVPVALTST